MWPAEGLKATSWRASRTECCCASEQLKPCFNVMLESHSKSWFKDGNLFLLLFVFSCRLINVLQPGSVRKINSASQNWHQVIHHPQGHIETKESFAFTLIPVASLELPLPDWVHTLWTVGGQSQRTQRQHLQTRSTQKGHGLWDRTCLVMHQHAKQNQKLPLAPFCYAFTM